MTMIGNDNLNNWPMVAVALAALLLVGCATTGGPKAAGPIFYPPAPAEPRLQYLVSYSSEKDLGGGPGQFVSFVVGEVEADKPIIKPYGLAMHGGKLYVCDTGASLVNVLDLEKRELTHFVPTGEAAFGTPVNIAIDEDGTQYVADTGRWQVLVFEANGSYRSAIGERVSWGPAKAHGGAAVGSSQPETPAKTFKPTDVAVRGDRLYVTDLVTHCVRVHNKKTLEELFTIPRNPEAEEESRKLFSPTNLAIGPEGAVYVSDLGAFRIQKYDADGNYLQSIGRMGDWPGEFARPKGVAVDRAGRLYAVDAASQVVQVFDDQGRLLMYFGQPGGSPAPLNLPAQVLVDYEHVPLFTQYAAPGFKIEHLVIVTSQYGGRKVNVYGFGQQE